MAGELIQNTVNVKVIKETEYTKLILMEVGTILKKEGRLVKDF